VSEVILELELSSVSPSPPLPSPVTNRFRNHVYFVSDKGTVGEYADENFHHIRDLTLCSEEEQFCPLNTEQVASTLSADRGLSYF
jgi:hypothetical protein